MAHFLGNLGHPTKCLSRRYPLSRQVCNRSSFPTVHPRPILLVPRPILGRSIKQDSCHLAAQFRLHQGDSPLHLPNHPDCLDPAVSTLFRAWEQIDPGKHRKCALTPKHLRFIAKYGAETGDACLVADATLLIGAFFFALRSCEYSRVWQPGRTQLLQVCNVQFYDNNYFPLDSASAFLDRAE